MSPADAFAPPLRPVAIRSIIRSFIDSFAHSFRETHSVSRTCVYTRDLTCSWQRRGAVQVSRETERLGNLS